MIRQIEISTLLFLLTCSAAWAGTPHQADSAVICVENFGPSDKFLMPTVISASDAGIKRGTAHILENGSLDLIRTRLVRATTMHQLLAVIHASAHDEPDKSKSFGTLRFTVLDSKSTRTVISGAPNAIALLKSLKAACGDDPLRDDLASLLSHEMAFVRGSSATK